MTNHRLYAIYVSAYADSSHFAGNGENTPWAAAGIESAWLSSTERAVAEFATDDATNGTPMRSKQQFERCLREGALMLHRLHQRDGPSAQVAAGRLPSSGVGRVAT